MTTTQNRVRSPGDSFAHGHTGVMGRPAPRTAHSRLAAALLAALGTLFLATGPVRGATVTQSLTLVPGWNAVWLEVDPVYTDGEDAGRAKPVEEVFTDPAITYVATPRLPVGTAEFITESAAGVFNQADWRTWQRSSELRQDTLATIRGYQAYLVKVSGAAPVAIDIEGEGQSGVYRLLVTPLP